MARRLIPISELAGLKDTAHLLRSPKNARRVLAAMRLADRRQGKLQTVDKLQRELSLK